MPGPLLLTSEVHVPTQTAWLAPPSSALILDHRKADIVASRHWQTCRGASPTLTYSMQFDAIGCRHIVLGVSGQCCSRLADVVGIDFDVRTGAVLWTSERNVHYETDAAYTYEWGASDAHIVTVEHDVSAHELRFFMNGMSMGIVLRDVPESCTYPAMALRGALQPNATTIVRLVENPPNNSQVVDLSSAVPTKAAAQWQPTSPTATTQLTVAATKQWQAFRSATPSTDYTVEFQSLGCRYLVLGLSAEPCARQSDVIGVQFDIRTGAVLRSSEQLVDFASDAAYSVEWQANDELVVHVQLNAKTRALSYFVNGRAIGVTLRNMPAACVYPAVALRGAALDASVTELTLR
ncbi:hypothetical protein SDRG_07478 [Saprolegnia diclina VS20]|uniref:SPRY domain-containing protein n=1 Tax=Saprolegnia diclina (strain VS20) TaxID=1156394 RepID=T0QN40_SAPDV|nr:hypothetical protein SDRG_07478 [Saprolegnia diclina VS20]EQC35250.1 hypothetical protein SDRG_07478 [Saprolegnia diclina VS20]|eukprot:XP_008611534.1 hypothetical protein SDRG_07478 [Saprolegnia diclina VS20]